jgi:hypothetical protein
MLAEEWQAPFQRIVTKLEASPGRAQGRPQQRMYFKPILSRDE